MSQPSQLKTFWLVLMKKNLTPTQSLISDFLLPARPDTAHIFLRHLFPQHHDCVASSHARTSLSTFPHHRTGQHFHMQLTLYTRPYTSDVTDLHHWTKFLQHVTQFGFHIPCWSQSLLEHIFQNLNELEANNFHASQLEHRLVLNLLLSFLPQLSASFSHVPLLTLLLGISSVWLAL